MSSRTFLRSTLACALLFFNPGSAKAQAPPGFTDAHVHLNDPATWIQLMDAAGIEQALVFRGRSINNEGLLAAARRWPTRLIPFLSISPEHREYRGRWAEDDLGLVQIVDSLLSGGGFKGIGEISAVHFPGAGFPEADVDPNGPVMRGIMEAAQRHAVPVSLHIEVTRLREFEALLSDYRDVIVIWAHGGYTPLFLAQRLLQNHPNLIYELSARTWRGHPRSPEYSILMNGEDVWPQWLDLIERMPERFLVGTDASLRTPESDNRKIDSVWNLLDQLSPEARLYVSHENIRRILGMGNE